MLQIIYNFAINTTQAHFFRHPPLKASNILTMSEVKERLTLFLKSKGVTNSEFSRLMGLSPGYVGSMRKSMPAEKIQQLLKIYPELNRDWLLYGEGEMIKEPPKPSQHSEPSSSKFFPVPLIPVGAAAGSFARYSEGVDFNDCEQVYCPFPGASCAIRVEGDSMEPRILDGTILFLQKIQSEIYIPWNRALVIDTDNGAIVKKLMPIENDDEHLEAISFNKEYPPFKIPTSGIYGIYRILGTIREGSI